MKQLIYLLVKYSGNKRFGDENIKFLWKFHKNFPLISVN